MTPPDLRMIRRAKTGDASAIALLMNRHLQTKGLVAHVVFQNTTLNIKLEGAQTPDQTASIQFIHRGISNLLPVRVNEVHLTGGRADQAAPDWEHRFRVHPMPEFLEAPTIEEVPLDPPERKQFPDATVVQQVDQALDQVIEPEEPPAPPISAVMDGIDASLVRSDGYGGEFLLEAEAFDSSEFSSLKDKSSDQLNRQAEPHAASQGEPSEPETTLSMQADEAESISAPTDGGSTRLLTGSILVGVVYSAIVSALVGWQFYAAASRKEPAASVKAASMHNEPMEDSANAAPAPNPSFFQDGVNLAMEATALTRAARTAQDWQQASDRWQAAAVAMTKVPIDDPNYAIALKKVEEYRRNRRYVTQKRLEAMAQ